MFAWTLFNVNDTIGIRSIIDRILKERKICREDLDVCKKYIDDLSTLDKQLHDMLKHGVEIVTSKIDDPNAISFIVEVLAGFKYAADDLSVGQLKHIKSNPNTEAILFLRAFCSNAMTNKHWEMQDMWFKTRVYCMDAYALSLILEEKRRTIVYYAGSAHTQNVVHYLLERGLARFENAASSNEIVKEINEICLQHDLIHIGCVRLTHGPLFFFCGEHHNQTKLDFAGALISFLKKYCNTQNVLFLIEKHISNQRDSLQVDLTCNQPDLAIHASRCHSFLETEHLTCENLKVLAVDNRHTDLGFLRMEIMDLWGYSYFTERAKEFNKRVLHSITAFCDDILRARNNQNEGLHQPSEKT